MPCPQASLQVSEYGLAHLIERARGVNNAKTARASTLAIHRAGALEKTIALTLETVKLSSIP
jgi:hypothetical protein